MRWLHFLDNKIEGIKVQILFTNGNLFFTFDKKLK